MMRFTNDRWGRMHVPTKKSDVWRLPTGDVTDEKHMEHVCALEMTNGEIHCANLLRKWNEDACHPVGPPCMSIWMRSHLVAALIKLRDSLTRGATMQASAARASGVSRGFLDEVARKTSWKNMSIRTFNHAVGFQRREAPINALPDQTNGPIHRKRRRLQNKLFERAII